jgi:hypothetical protein
LQGFVDVLKIRSLQVGSTIRERYAYGFHEVIEITLGAQDTPRPANYPVTIGN